ncbi:hypothetical protein PHMEG_00030897 [Phytophthora megakarya]|uniref:Uncharacterized protein n=1 Tax=Phytophthora megakarya TaxID=4795 RepID=A0A225UZV7_9STRA|nr:hypothetical protein PHMEG_00030897 [Phytophthora megakarya]
MTFDVAISNVLALQFLKEEHFTRTWNRIGTAVNFNYDTEMSNVLRLISKHAAELVHEQYKVATNPYTTIAFKKIRDSYYKISRGKMESLNTHFSDSTSTMLSCYVLSSHVEIVVPLHSIHERWLLRGNAFHVMEIPSNRERFKYKANTILHGNDCISKLSDLQTKIATWMHNADTSHFDVMFESLERAYNSAIRGELSAIRDYKENGDP